MGLRSFSRAAVPAALIIAWVCGSCAPEPKNEIDPCRGQKSCYTCEVSDDCPAELPHCATGFCRKCVDDSHCSCHEVCENYTCGQLGAVDVSSPASAHGNWSGRPDRPGYTAVDICKSDADCADPERFSLGSICNPLTGGCIDAANYETSCTRDEDCEGLAGMLACAPTLGLCVPAASCRSERNCCGVRAPDIGLGENPFVCDTVFRVCRAPAFECSLATEDYPVSQCPTDPRVRDNCALGEFCTPGGRCAQCACDADCATGLSCRAGVCVSPSYCTAGGMECGPDEACDLIANLCKARCADDGDCGAALYCHPEMLVCRSREELACEPDPIDPRDDERAGAEEVRPPDVGDFALLGHRSLCQGDQDWLQMHLYRGDQINITGVSTPSLGSTGLRIHLTAYATDGVSVLDTGIIADIGHDQLSFIVNRDGHYWVHIEAEPGGEGFYDLTMSRTAAPACVDSWEDDRGSNDTPAEATLLSPDVSAPAPASCELLAGGASTTIKCNDLMYMCPGDVDYYRIYVPATAQLDVVLDVADGYSGNLDMALYGPYVLPGDLATEPLVARTQGTSSVERLQHHARPGGHFLLQVERVSGTTTPYNLRATVTVPPVTCREDGYDSPIGSNDQAEGAIQVAMSVNTRVSLTDPSGGGLTLCPGDQDWFEVGLATGGRFSPLSDNLRVVADLLFDGLPATGVTLTGITDDGLTLGSADPSAATHRVRLVRSSDGQRLFLGVIGGSESSVGQPYQLRVGVESSPMCGDDVLGDQMGAFPPSNDQPLDATLLEAPDWPAAVGEETLFLLDSSADPALSLCALDADWYHIAMPADSQIQVWTEHDPDFGDLGLALFDASVLDATVTDPTQPPPLGRIAMSERDGRGYQEVRGVPSGGEAYIMVYNRSHWPVANYGLGIRFLPRGCVEDVYDLGGGNDSFDKATPVQLRPSPSDRQVEVGVLSPLAICRGGAERDWYSVWLAEGDKLDASIYYNPNQGDLDLHLAAPGTTEPGARLRSDWDDTNPTGLLDVHYQVPMGVSAGDYLLELVPWDAQNNYFLEAVVQRACIDDSYEPLPPSDATTVAWVDNLRIGNLVLCSDEDWYAVQVPDGPTTMSFCVRFDHARADVDLELYDAAPGPGGLPPTGASLIAASYSKTDLERVSALHPGASTYYLRVSLDPYRPRITTTYDLWAVADSAVCPVD